MTMTTLLRQIQEMSTDPTIPLAALLRKSMVLARRLSYEPLKSWAQYELQGYPQDVDLPDYRARRNCQVFGRFEAGVGQWFVNPIPSANVEAQHRDGLFSYELRLGVARYEGLLDGDEVEIPWDQNLVVFYRDAFYADYALERAWRSLPSSDLAQMLDAVRTRLLDFVLEIEELDPAAGEAEPGVQPIPPGQVTQIFHQTFSGDNTAFAAAGHAVRQSQRVDVQSEAVLNLLEDLGVEETERFRLRDALEADGGVAGPQTKEWLRRLETGAVQIGTGVSVQVAVAALSGALGIA